MVDHITDRINACPESTEAVLWRFANPILEWYDTGKKSRGSSAPATPRVTFEEPRTPSPSPSLPESQAFTPTPKRPANIDSLAAVTSNARARWELFSALEQERISAAYSAEYGRPDSLKDYLNYWNALTTEEQQDLTAEDTVDESDLFD